MEQLVERILTCYVNKEDENRPWTKEEDRLVEYAVFLKQANDSLARSVERLTSALETYADRNNWQETARTHVLTGEVRADGYEEEDEVELVMGSSCVWTYNYGWGNGYELAEKTLG